jgi:hypothetical protein
MPLNRLVAEPLMRVELNTLFIVMHLHLASQPIGQCRAYVYSMWLASQLPRCAADAFPIHSFSVNGAACPVPEEP